MSGRKTGAAGFIKGIGLGLVGVAVKPIMYVDIILCIEIVIVIIFY